MHRSLNSIIETRKRKASPIDLGAILRPTKLPREKFNALQGVLNAQDDVITERGAEIKERCTQIHNLKSELSEARADIDLYRRRIEQKHNDLVDSKKQLEGTYTDLFRVWVTGAATARLAGC